MVIKKQKKIKGKKDLQRAKKKKGEQNKKYM